MSGSITIDAADARRIDGTARAPAAMANTFYVRFAAFLLVLLVAGFGPTFFFRPFLGLEPLGLPAILHGTVLTAWFVFFFVQAGLVRDGNVALHRKLGMIGASVAAIGTFEFNWMAVELFDGRPPNVEADLVEKARLVRIVRELAVFAAFPVLVGLAVMLRRRAAAHKRLMLLATIALTPPVVSRLVFWPGQVWPELATGSRVVGALSGTALLLIIVIVHELIAYKRVHPALAWGAPLWFLWLIGSGLATPMILFRLL